jgi:hypothetical protein
MDAIGVSEAFTRRVLNAPSLMFFGPFDRRPQFTVDLNPANVVAMPLDGNRLLTRVFALAHCFRLHSQRLWAIVRS